jgi:hypothetical protein
MELIMMSINSMENAIIVDLKKQRQERRLQEEKKGTYQ